MDMREKFEDSEYGKMFASVKRVEKHESTGKEGCLWTVTTVARSGYGGTSTPVICSTLARAQEIVETNEGDIWEHSYMVCVIEGVVPDELYSSARCPQFWYAWDSDSCKYVPIETPEMYQRTFGWGVG